jgi:hypothetical protein
VLQAAATGTAAIRSHFTVPSLAQGRYFNIKYFHRGGKCSGEPPEGCRDIALTYIQRLRALGATIQSADLPIYLPFSLSLVVHSEAGLCSKCQTIKVKMITGNGDRIPALRP